MQVGKPFAYHHTCTTFTDHVFFCEKPGFHSFLTYDFWCSMYVSLDLG